MAENYENYGLTHLGTVEMLDIFASPRQGRELWIVVKGGQGTLKRGTMLMLDSETGKYVEYDGTTTFAGVLTQEADTGASDAATDVKTFMKFDCDLSIPALFATTDLAAGYYKDSGIILREGE